VSYRTAIVEYYRKHPTATQEQVRLATHAPKSAVRFVYAQLVDQGVLTRPRNAESKAQAYGLPSSSYGYSGSKWWGRPSMAKGRGGTPIDPVFWAGRTPAR
jgi:hypothetical protein